MLRIYFCSNGLQVTAKSDDGLGLKEEDVMCTFDRCEQALLTLFAFILPGCDCDMEPEPFVFLKWGNETSPIFVSVC